MQTIGKPVEAAVVASLFRQLFTGLAFIHDSAKIIHRDIKPDNLLLNPGTGQLKICDFGLSHLPQAPGLYANPGFGSGVGGLLSLPPSPPSSPPFLL